MRTTRGLPFSTAKVVGRPQNSVLQQLTPLSKEGFGGSFDNEAEALPEELALEEAAWARSCLALAYDLTNTGVNEIFNQFDQI